MQVEYQMLVIMTLFFIFAFAPASAAKFLTYGGRWLASNRVKTPNAELPEWGARFERAHSNLKDYFPGFIVAILLLGLVGKFDNSTKYASIIYVVTRLLHFVGYGIGIVPIRFVSYMMAMAANVFLLVKILC